MQNLQKQQDLKWKSRSLTWEIYTNNDFRVLTSPYAYTTLDKFKFELFANADPVEASELWQEET